MKKLRYVSPVIEYIELEEADIIATSGLAAETVTEMVMAGAGSPATDGETTITIILTRRDIRKTGKADWCAGGVGKF